MIYGSVLDFLRTLKKSGGGTARDDHRPLSSASLARLIRGAPRPFRASYKVLYAQMTVIDAAAVGAREQAFTDEDLGR